MIKKNKYSELEIQYVRLCNFDDFSEQEKLNRKLRETFFQDWGTVGEIPELITKKDIEKYPDAYQYLPYRLGIRYEIDYFSYPVLLSMAIHKSGFTGGAHGWNNSHTINYDFRTHKEITLEDLFFDPVRGIKTVSEYCKTEIMEECEESDNVDHLFMTKFDYKSQDFGDLFTVSDTGLEMYFQDVLPHSLGSHRYVTVPWELLHPYLKPGFLPFLN